MIKPKQLPGFLILFFAALANRLLRWRFNKVVVSAAAVKPGHSILLLCNHFSFWDGFFGAWLAFYGLHKQQAMKGFYIMSVEKQLRLNMWMRYFGSFSIAPGKSSITESLDYAAHLLNTPGNVLLFFPQGNLESCHVREIVFQDGINQIIPKITGDCQIIWSSNLTEYFESLKPSVTFSLLDCGTNREYDFEKLVHNVNAHHRQALADQLRFTKSER